MKHERATININIDCPINNAEFDNVITQIISLIHNGQLKGDGIINDSLFNYEISNSYLKNFTVHKNKKETRLIFQSKINQNV